MAIFEGRNRNTNNEASLSSAIALNSTTTTTVQVANERRIFFAYSNPDNKDVWLKFQEASLDDDKKGLFIPKNGYWEMPMDSIYIGEISAIAVSGTPNAYPTEY